MLAQHLSGRVRRPAVPRFAGGGCGRPRYPSRPAAEQGREPARPTSRSVLRPQGHVRRRHLDDQVDQALCLTLVTNAAILWTTTYLGDALDALQADGYAVTDENAAHLTPAQHDHINFYGTYSFDIDAELGREGHRPLRVTA